MGGLGQAAGHQGDHGPQDHGFVAGGPVLVVADGAPVLADPGEGPLHDPAAGQHLEGVPVALGDDLECHLQGLGPGGGNTLVPSRWQATSRSVERQLKAEYARKAYMQKLALTSAARRRKTSTALCMNAVSHGTSTGSSGAWPSMVSSRRRCDTGVTVARSSFPTVEGQASAFCDPTTDPRRMFRQRMSAS